MNSDDHREALALVDALRRRNFEHSVTLPKGAFYALERAAGHWLYRRPPPDRGNPRLLNLGAGTLRYEGWVNADEYGFKRAFRDRSFAPDWMLDITRAWTCPADYWDGIFSQHVIEHLSYSEAVHVFEECLRTLKPGAWLRISVPDVKKYFAGYRERSRVIGGNEFPSPALAVSYLTQMHFHRSAWDGELMCAVLSALGLVDAREVEFGEGTDARLLKDQPAKRFESLYVEGRKPPTSEGRVAG